MTHEIPTGIRPTTHHIRVNGCTYEFQLAYIVLLLYVCHAPGVVPFDVSGVMEARDILRGVYQRDDS